MAKKKIFMSVTATAVIASAFMGNQEVNAASHTVKNGDTLWSISQKYQTSVDHLKAINNLSNSTIYANQVLELNKIEDNPGLELSNNEANQVLELSNNEDKKISAIVKQVPKRQVSNSVEQTETEKQENTVVTKPSEVKNSTTKPKETAPNNAPTSNASTYTIKSGDTLSQIAFQHGISLNELMSWNNLESTLIFPGDTLIVKKGAVTNSPKQETTPVTGVVTDKKTDAKPKVEESPTLAASELIDVAKSALGTPYLWGGSTTSGFDCSGFIYWALNKTGSNIGRHSTEGYYNRSYIVNTPQIGDFVFFENTYKQGISHMGIYIGDNKFIHASTSQGVTITDLSNPYWSERFHSYKKLY